MADSGIHVLESEGITRPYSTRMNIQIKNGSTTFILPDPSEWNYQVGDLDTSGSRDATGLLHRAYVATKINYEFTWNALEWAVLQRVLAAISAEKFTLTAPDPRDFSKWYTGDYYVGDRTGKGWYFIPERDEIANFELKLKFIEY